MGHSPLDQIIIVEYDLLWPRMFEDERRILACALKGWSIAIEHIGSTAVPDLCAKPIIDIMVGITDLGSAVEHVEPLEKLGYRYVPGDDDEVRLFFRKGMPRTHHLHIVVHGGAEWRKHILLRDALRADPALKERYAILKHDSAVRSKDDRQAYVDSKSELIDNILQQLGPNQK